MFSPIESIITPYRDILIRGHNQPVRSDTVSNVITVVPEFPTVTINGNTGKIANNNNRSNYRCIE